MAVYKYKGSVIAAPFTILTNKPFYEAETYNLKVQRASQDAQRWEISFTTLARDNDAVNLFVSLIEDMDTVDTMIMPQLVQSEISGTLTTNAASSGDDFFTLDTITGVSNSWKKGEFISFQNHDKVYIVLQDTNAGGNVPVYPSLVTNIPSGTTVYTGDNVLLTYNRSADTITGITFNDGVLASPGTVTLIEAV
ncbi:hypothetical protein N9Z41_02580 [bacterium]|nr:hypothetical protein [bacterium]